MFRFFTYKGRDPKGRALYFDSKLEQYVIDTDDVSSFTMPQFSLQRHNVCTMTPEGEPDQTIYHFGFDEDVFAYEYDCEDKFTFKTGNVVWRPYMHRDDGSKDFAIFHMGGLPHIASIRFETWISGGGFDLASIANIIDGKPQWCKDAWLLTEKEKAVILAMCKEYGNK